MSAELPTLSARTPLPRKKPGSLLRWKLAEQEQLAYLGITCLPPPSVSLFLVRIPGQLRCHLLQEVSPQTSTYLPRKF